MGIYLDAAEVTGASAAVADELIDDLETKLALHFPCITLDLPSLRLEQLRVVMLRIVRRWLDGGTGMVQSEAAGPFSRTLRDGNPRILWSGDLDDLRAICEQAPAASGLPEGSFPAPSGIERLFGRWPR